MISRKTGLLIANIVANSFVNAVKESYNSGRNCKYVQRVNADVLRDFLFEYGVRGYSIEKICKSYDSKQDLKENIMNMHTGVFYKKVNYCWLDSPVLPGVELFHFRIQIYAYFLYLQYFFQNFIQFFIEIFK